MTPEEGRELGKKRAERGLKRAACKHDTEIRRDILRFLDALLASCDGTGTTDDTVDDLRSKFSDGGKWRGNITQWLLKAGLIFFTGWAVSARPSRHGGNVKVWKLVDRDAAVRYRDALKAEIARDAGESAATDSPAVNSTNPTFTGETNDGQAQ